MTRASSQPTISLIVLAYNEEENLAPFVHTCERFLDELGGDNEILIVDDGSSDATGARAEELAQGDARVRVLSHARNRGMGAGMRTGYENARCEYGVVLPADGQIAPDEIYKLLPALARAPIVTSVYTRAANGMLRLGISFGFRTMMRLVLGTAFRLEGIYLFPIEVAQKQIGLQTIVPDTFFFSFELISRAMELGYAVETVTINPLPRQAGTSKVANLNRIKRVASEVINLRIRRAREKA